MKKMILTTFMLMFIVCIPVSAAPNGAADISTENTATSEDEDDTMVDHYDFDSLEQLMEKFQEVQMRKEPSDRYIDDFFLNETIYFLVEVPWLDGGFEKITVYQNFMAVDYQKDKTRFSFHFYPPNGHEETGEQFFTNHVLNKENLKETFDVNGTTIYLSHYYTSGTVVYAWEQNGCYFCWLQYDPNSSDISMEKFRDICKAIPYATNKEYLSLKNKPIPLTGRA